MAKVKPLPLNLQEVLRAMRRSAGLGVSMMRCSLSPARLSIDAKLICISAALAEPDSNPDARNNKTINRTCSGLFVSIYGLSCGKMNTTIM